MSTDALEAIADTEDALGIEGIQLQRGDVCTYSHRTGDVSFERGVSILSIKLSKYQLEGSYFKAEAFKQACEKMAAAFGFSLGEPSDDGLFVRIELR